MYAVKPWGNVLVIGAGVGSYTMGVGMRWRESNVSIIERRKDPSYEAVTHRRCVVTNQTVKLLSDLGVSEWKIRTALRPTRGWRFADHSLRVLKESTTFPGCALGETSFHCSEGPLIRLLRTELLRFGGSVQWECEAYEPVESGDGSDTWSLRKDFGMGSGAEAILTMAKGTGLDELLFAKDPERIALAFDIETGVTTLEKDEASTIFGQTDVCIVVGNGLAIHLWVVDPTSLLCSYRIVRAKKDASSPEAGQPTSPATTASETGGLQMPSDEIAHPLLRKAIGRATRRRLVPCFLPGTVPAIRDEATHMRISVLGDGLLPVDPFEWRGDHARTQIEEASALCRLFYGKKYHRGDVASLLRELEQDSLSKRANLLKRDILDAEHFLEVHPRLDSGSLDFATEAIAH